MPPRPPVPKGLSWDGTKLCSRQDYYEDCIECCREKMPSEPAKCVSHQRAPHGMLALFTTLVVELAPSTVKDHFASIFPLFLT